MQRIATRVFIAASVVFGVLGVIQAATIPNKDADMTSFNRLVTRLLMTSVFVILTSFALSVAGKYLKDK